MDCFRDIQRVEKEMAQIQKKKLEQYEAYRSGQISRDDFLAVKEQITAQTNCLTEKKKSLEEQYQRYLSSQQAQTGKEHDRRRNGNAAAVAEMAAAVAEIKAAAVALKNATGKFAAVIHSGDVSDVVTVRKTVAETAYRCVADVRGVPVDCVKIFVNPPAPVGRDNLPPCASPCGDGTGGETEKETQTMKKKPTAKKPTAAKVAAKPAKKTATAKKPAKVAKKPAKK